jgi:hypothetical protein
VGIGNLDRPVLVIETISRSELVSIRPTIGLMEHAVAPRSTAHAFFETPHLLMDTDDVASCVPSGGSWIPPSKVKCAPSRANHAGPTGGILAGSLPRVTSLKVRLPGPRIQIPAGGMPWKAPSNRMVPPSKVTDCPEAAAFNTRLAPSHNGLKS